MNATYTDSALIDRLGGTSKVARLCGISSQAVSQWREAGIPRPWMKFLQLAHPEAFGEKVKRRRSAAVA